MGNAENIELLPVKSLHAYKNNPRKNDEAAKAVAASIKEFGFRSPVIIDENNEIICGHTRVRAAKKLGMETVPCIRVTDLTDEQKRQYRLIDNKSGELAKWDGQKMQLELQALTLDNLDFKFDFAPDLKTQKAWKHESPKCGMNLAIVMHKVSGSFYRATFATGGDDGQTLDEIKCPENVEAFACAAAEMIVDDLGNVAGAAIVTTPRRRHRDGFHFATAVCDSMSAKLGIPFYSDAITVSNRDRSHPKMSFVTQPAEKLLFLYDDIITTGLTLTATRQMLVDAGHTVYAVVSIDNKY